MDSGSKYHVPERLLRNVVEILSGRWPSFLKVPPRFEVDMAGHMTWPP
jgi:hypothetical protein